ncbi:hypothetical protein, unknown function, partial [Leishmania braziliensis MHOM/BR/75/M2904]
MSYIPLEGSVVSYEFLDAHKEWLWGVGTVTRCDDRVCVIKQWVGATVDETMVTKLESEAASSKAEAKAYQERLLAIRGHINSQDSRTSKEERERTSQELSECLALIGKHRNHSRSLLADLERIKGSSVMQVKCQHFAPASSSITVLCSSVLRVISQTTVPFLLLSSEEVDSMEEVIQSRNQLNSELHKLRAAVEAANIENDDLHNQLHHLAEQLKCMENVSTPIGISDGVESGSVFSEKLKEHQHLDLLSAWDKNAASVVTDHTITFPWVDGDTLLHHKPEETKSVFIAEAAFACCAPIQCVTNLKMAARGKHLSAEFSVSHPATLTTKEINQRLSSYPFPSMHGLHEDPLGAKTGLDKAIERLEHALGIPEGKHEGLCFDEFMENMPDTTFSSDKDAYESEIGDLLMLLDKLNNENRSLQYTLDKSAIELKKQLAASQRDQDALHTEVAQLRHIVAKLKDLAEQQEKQLEEHRLQKKRAEQTRFRHHLALLEDPARNSEYAVTIDEYHRQKEAADNLQAAVIVQKAKTDEMHQLLKDYELQCTQATDQLSELKEALAVNEEEKNQNLRAIESELMDTLIQLKAAEAYAQVLLQVNTKQKEELTAFRQKRIKALAQREASGCLPSPTSSKTESAPHHPISPTEITREPLYAVTLEEYRDRDAAVGQLAAELEEKRAEAEKLAAELEEKSAEAEKLAAEVVEQRAEAEKLAAELEEQRAEAEKLAAEVAAFRAKRNAALEARDADGTLPVLEKAVAADEAAAQALDPRQIADGPLYAVTLEELLRAREEAARNVEAMDDNAAALESELLDVLMQSKVMKGENAALEDLCKEKDAAVADLEKHDVRANNSDKAKPQTTSRHSKVFEGEEWGTVMATKPHALHEAFVSDVCAACRVGRDDLSEVTFALGSLMAGVSVTHNSDISCDDIAKLVMDYHYPNVWALYAKRWTPKDGLDAAKDMITELQVALAAKEEEAAKNAAELEEQRAEAEKLAAEVVEQRAEAEKLAAELVEQRAEAEKLAAEVAAFRAKRNAALEARDADGTLPVLEKAVAADEAAAQALDPRQIADGPLYAVTLEEYRDRDAAVGQLAAELEEQRAEAEKLAAELVEQRAEAGKLAAEVAAFCAKRNAALEARDADGTLPVLEKAVAPDEAAAQALDPRHIADGPLYAVTLEEYRDRDAAVGQLAAELEEQRAEAEKLAAELEEQRAEAGKLAAELEEKRAEAEKLAAELEEKRAEAEKLAAELEEKRAEAEKLAAEVVEKRAEAEKLAAELEEQRAEAEKLAAELEEKRAEAEKLAAELEEKRAEAEKLAAELEEQRAEAEKLAAEVVEQRAEAEKLAAELEEQRAEAEKLAAEVAAFRAKRNAALEARDADGTLPVLEKAVAADEAAAQALDPRQIADGPLYAVTLEEYRDRDAAVGQLAAELEEQRAEAEKLAAELEEQRAEAEKLAAELEEQRAEAEKLAAEVVEQRAEAEKLAAEVAAFRAKRNAALEARDADGTLPVLEKAVAADEAAAQALDPRQIADGPLYAVTLEELLRAREEAA